MNKFIVTMMLGILTHSYCLASYEIDFLIGETKNTQPLTTSLRLKSFNLSEKSEILNKEEISNIIKPSQSMPIKIKEHEIKNIKIQDYCDFCNSSNDEKNKNPFWQSIVLEAQVSEEKWEEVPLYWAHLGSSVFISGDNNNFLWCDFQRKLPSKQKDETILYTIEVGLKKNN